MYLELLENKDKVRQNLVNKEYDPDETETVFSFLPNQREQEPNIMPSIMESENSEKETESSFDEKSHESLGSEEEDEEEEDSLEETISEDQEQDVEEEESVQDVSTNHIKNRIYEMLHEEPAPQNIAAPTLSDLQRTGDLNRSKAIPNLDRLISPETQEEEEEMKRELLFKFDLLKKSYKNADIPVYSMHTDLRQMNRSYENILRRVSLDSNVDNYKNLLICAFMVMEFILGYWLKFDMAGFTQQQIINMTQYERLLIELGEKSYVPGGSQWPVEVRLLGLVVMNAAIFIISKMIMKKTGSSLISMMNSVPTNPSIPVRKRRMRGPQINPDDLPDEDTLLSEEI